MNNTLEQTILRFDSLYPRLVKQKVKETGMGDKMAEIMSASNQASKQTQSELIAKQLSTQQRVKLISTIAKSEIEGDQTLLPSLTQEVDKICHLPIKESFSDVHLFVCSMFILAAPMEDTTTLLVNIMTRAEQHLSQQQKVHGQENDAAEYEVSLQLDTHFQSMMDFAMHVLRKGILKRDLKGPKAGVFTIKIFNVATQKLQEFIQSQKQVQFIQLAQFAPRAIWLEILEDIFFNIKNQRKSDLTTDILAQPEKQEPLCRLINTAFELLQLYKNNSKYYMVKIGSVLSRQNNSQTGEQTISQPAVRREGALFSELLNIIVDFICAYLTSAPPSTSKVQCQQVFQILMSSSGGIEEDQGDKSNFTLQERLTILQELNFLFQKLPEVYMDDTYWQLIREGLYDADQACRKLALTVLKGNLHQHQYKDSKKFETLWTTFFDVYDTLECFASHLTKAVWHRTEVFYDFIKQNDALYIAGAIHPLEDMRMWLLVLYHRVGSHNNLKVRRFIQKKTLSRDYITTHMTDFFFNEFISWLNQCLIFKDVNSYTQFSKNAHLVLKFFGRYFSNESLDHEGDLKAMFLGFSRNKSHSQMILICLKVLQTDFNTQVKFISTKELQVLSNMIDSVFMDQVLSGKYLCFKYILRMCSKYLKPVEDWQSLFKLISFMPIEFFSSRTICDDRLARESALVMINQVPNMHEVCLEFLKSMFTVKATVSSMPKFGKDADLILAGISKLLIASPSGTGVILGLVGCMEAIDQAVMSTYLSARLVESKIHCLVQLFKCLFEYGTGEMVQAVVQHLAPRLGSLLSRFWDQLFVPLMRESGILVSENDRIEASLKEIQTYISLLQLTIKMMHLHLSVQDNALESFIKNILTKVLQLSSARTGKNNDSWSSYIMTYACFEMLQALLNSYSIGIKESIKRGVSHCHIPEDLFVIGKPILQNLLTFTPFTRANGDEPITRDQDHLLIELDTNTSKINQQNMLNLWKSIGHFLVIFQFDSQLREEIQLHQQELCNKTLEFLESATEEYNSHLFQILKVAYIPIVMQGLNQDHVNALETYQLIIRRCWSILKALNREIDAESLQEFLEFAFNVQVMEQIQQMGLDATMFNKQICTEIIAQGDKYWLILRSLFNHLMLIFATRPHLMLGMEWFVVKLGTSREVRSLDAEIKLFKIETMLPEVIPKKYENLPIDKITYEGAYIRTLTLLILEGIIQDHHANYKNGNQKQLAIRAALENIILQLLNLNMDKKAFGKADQPYSESHRYKIRTWQFLVMLQSIFIQDYQASPSFVEEINQLLWPILRQNHVTNVRQYIEVFTMKFVTKFPEVTMAEGSLFYDTCLDMSISKPQLSASLLLVAGFVLLNTKDFTLFKRKIFDRLVGFASSNSAHVRCMTQYFILKFAEKEPALVGSAVQPLINYLKEAKDVQKMMSKYAVTLNLVVEKLKLEGAQAILCHKVDEQGEYMSVPIVEELEAVTLECMTEYRHEDPDEIPQMRRDFWKAQFEERKKEEDFNVRVTEESSNYQRKILPWEHVEFDQKTQKRVFFQRRRNEIIMCASLIDKIPNLAGLARTSEIMNASSLIINWAGVCQLDEFKGISVTSEKWLPIYEVKEKDLLDYLMYQKSNGYKIVGIEQTANSQMLHQFKFPTRCVLLLGKEKEGIPQEYYSLLDYCVEIPQFGIVRSLNVHVSGALCLWEYTKQHMPKVAPSAQTNIM